MLSLLRRSIVTVVFLSGSTLLVGLVAARFGTWQRPALLDILDMVALFACTPFIGVALVAAVFRSRVLGILTALALVFVVQQFGGELRGVFSPNDAAAAPAAANPSRLRVLTYNLRSPNDDPYHLVDYVREAQPDVIVLQEATADYVRVFGQVMNVEYPFSVLTGTDTDHDGVATWSRYPLFDPQPIHLSYWGNEMHSVRLSTGQQAVTLYAVHLANVIDDPDESLFTAWRRYAPADRDEEIAGLSNLTSGQVGPYILAGDFNSVAGSRPYRSFPAAWHDVFAESGRGFGNTFPVPLHEREPGSHLFLPAPLVRIDYILTSADITGVRAWTTKIPVSDHLATLADLDLPPVR